jgi:uncharacterized protein YdeI (YjbR/CyaY-like superfamily)
MTDTGRNPKVDFYFLKPSRWQNEQAHLRKIVLDTMLTEELKWGVPCYTCQKRNIVIILAFKEYCAVLFVKGALLKDEAGMLIRQSEQVQSARQMRFTTVGEVKKAAAALKAYIFEAIEVEKAGLKVKLKTPDEYEVAREFQDALDEMPKLKAAFDALTPGRKRGYLLYFSGAKQSQTRVARVEKSIPRILKGKGLNDD